MLKLSPYEEEIFATANEISLAGRKSKPVSLTGVKLYAPNVTASFDGKPIIIQTVCLLKDKSPVSQITITGIVTETTK